MTFQYYGEPMRKLKPKEKLDDLPMLERAARALFAIDYGQTTHLMWDRQPQGQKDYYISLVRAVIESLMQPSEAVLGAGEWLANSPHVHDRQALIECWQAMLKAILEDADR